MASTSEQTEILIKQIPNVSSPELKNEKLTNSIKQQKPRSNFTFLVILFICLWFGLKYVEILINHMPDSSQLDTSPKVDDSWKFKSASKVIKLFEFQSKSLDVDGAI